jgi:hypothetical protein
MTTLRQAAQQALEALEFMADEWGFTQKANRPERWQAIDALRAALAQEDEPKGGGNLPPPLQAEPVQEPVVVKDSWGLTLKAGWDDLPIDTKLYAHPPRREWRSLSEEEIRRMGIETPGQQGGWNLAFARAIEAKLKEKNHG